MLKKSILTAMGLTMLSSSFAQNHSTMKNINHNAPVKCSTTIAINANSNKVWAVFSDVNKWPNWQTDITRSKLNGELKPESTFDWASNGVNIHSILHTVAPAHQIGWTGKGLGLWVIHNWTLTERDGKTIVTVEESMEGLLAKIFKKVFNKSLDKSLRTWLELLKKESEK